MINTSFSLPKGITAHLTSKSPSVKLGPTEKMLLQAYVPGLNVLDEILLKPDLSILHRESAQQTMLQTDNQKKITICDLWRDQVSFDIYHLLYGLTRKELLVEEAYSVHSACVEKNGRHILLIGHSGSGKSTTALKLVEDHGQKMVSGNKTVVTFDDHNQIQVIAGTPTMTIRQSDHHKFASVIGESVSYFDRLAFKLKPEQYTTPFGGKVEAIVFVQLNDGVQDFKQLNSHGAVHRSFPFFLDVVNADVLVCQEKALFDGTPPEGIKDLLRKSLSNALQKTPVYSAVGTLPFVANQIAQL